MCENLRNKLIYCNSDNNQSIIQIKIWERFWHRLANTSPYTHERVIDEIKKKWDKNIRNEKNYNEKRVKFILRVDDFPRWDLPLKVFLNFDTILAKFGIKYCLGVTPRVATDPLNPFSNYSENLSGEATEILKKISYRVNIALHGLTHRTRGFGIRGEFSGLNSEIIEKYIIDGINLLKRINVSPIGFIPPFNSISFSELPVLNQYFRILFGGPESVATIGFHISPSILYDMIYLPSYPPAYGEAKEMQNFVRRLKQLSLPIIVPLTIHWAWEKRDNFCSFEKLCKELIDWTISIDQLQSIYADFDAKV